MCENMRAILASLFDRHKSVTCIKLFDLYRTDLQRSVTDSLERYLNSNSSQTVPSNKKYLISYNSLVMVQSHSTIK